MRVTPSQLKSLRTVEDDRTAILHVERYVTSTGGIEVGGIAIGDGTGTILLDLAVCPPSLRGKARNKRSSLPSLADVTSQVDLVMSTMGLIVGDDLNLAFNALAADGLHLDTTIQRFDVTDEYASLVGKWDARHNDWKRETLAHMAKHYGIRVRGDKPVDEVLACAQCFHALLDDPSFEELVKEQGGKRANREILPEGVPQPDKPRKAARPGRGAGVALVVIALLLGYLAVIETLTFNRVLYAVGGIVSLVLGIRRVRSR
jgi:hypothetical protein